MAFWGLQGFLGVESFFSRVQRSNRLHDILECKGYISESKEVYIALES